MDRSAELHRLLAEYRVMEKEMARLEETRKTLRAAIQGLLEAEGTSAFAAIVNGEQILLELKTHTEIRYDEALLRTRLGIDYHRFATDRPFDLALLDFLQHRTRRRRQVRHRIHPMARSTA